MKTTLRYFSVLLLLVQCCSLRSFHTTASKDHLGNVHRQAPQVTVWVHGTSSNPFLRKLHTSPPGLRVVASLHSSYSLKKVIHSLCKTDPELFNYEHFYTFGWSGKLSPSQRALAAKNLYHCLNKLRAAYRNRYGVHPRLRLITHSHGGNVALNLATVVQNETDLTVDELVLLACPVQHNTEDFIGDPLFKRIYSMYSNNDMLQVLDPQGLYAWSTENHAKEKHLFSKRKFPCRNNLKQAHIKMGGRGPFHVEFVMEHFVQKLPDIIKIMDAEATIDESLLIRF